MPASSASRSVRVAQSCGSAKAWVEVSGGGSYLVVGFGIEQGRPGTWQVNVLHERNLVGRRSFSLARGKALKSTQRVPNYPGDNRVTVRSTDPLGRRCELTAVLKRI